MTDKIEAAYHPGHSHACRSCDRMYPSRVAADICEMEDTEDDRASRIRKGID